MIINEKKLREILKLFRDSNNKDFKDAIVNVVFILSKNKNDVLVDNKELISDLKIKKDFGMKRKITKVKLSRSLQDKIADLLDKEKLTGANLDEVRIRMRYGEEGEIKLYFITELEDKDLEIETPG